MHRDVHHSLDQSEAFRQDNARLTQENHDLHDQLLRAADAQVCVWGGATPATPATHYKQATPGDAALQHTVTIRDEEIAYLRAKVHLCCQLHIHPSACFDWSHTPPQVTELQADVPRADNVGAQQQAAAEVHVLRQQVCLGHPRAHLVKAMVNPCTRWRR